MHYQLLNVQYLYKDQYGKHVFSIPKSAAVIKLLHDKIEKYGTVNPIFQKSEDSDFIVKFNDTKFLFKARVNYDLIYFIHKNQNKKSKKYYINLHISDMRQKDKKEVTKVTFENL